MSGNAEPGAEPTILTVGHSNHEPDDLLSLLRQHRVDVVVDVRSSPYSRYASQFNRENLQANLRAEGFGYEFMGDVIGGLIVKGFSEIEIGQIQVGIQIFRFELQRFEICRSCLIKLFLFFE